VLSVVLGLNDDPEITGILLLRPLPAHLDEVEVFAALTPLKDIEAVPRPPPARRGSANTC
jgi:methylenetetrahydrofolate dehydrogenase (NADP+)/methenyltetrahydrofolate cyclohydrolase